MIRVTETARNRRSSIVHAVHPAKDYLKTIERGGQGFTSCGRWLGRPQWRTEPGDIQQVDCESCLLSLASHSTRRRAA